MPPPLILPFLLTVAIGVAGVMALAFLFAALSPWVQRQVAALLKDLSSKKHP